MLQTKLFEIRDSATFIPVLAVRLSDEHANDAERYLLERAGWRTFPKDTTLLLVRLGQEERGTRLYASSWPSGVRTMRLAHEYISAYFEKLETGEVIDVEFIMGWTKEKKKSERFTESSFARSLRDAPSPFTERPMASQVGGDLSKIETGPSKVTYKTVACGHTMEGVKFSVTPDLRERRVLDE